MSAPAAKYFDKRTTFFKRYFEQALGYDAYLASGQDSHVAKWTRFYDSIELSALQLSLLKSFKRQVHVLCLSGIWCGDCARQGPILRRIEEASDVISCRFIDNQAHPELRDELRVLGAERVPVMLFLSEDFFEIERYGDRTLSAYRRKAESELGLACDAGLVPPAVHELSQELDDWLREFERLQLMLRLAPALRARYGD